MTHYFTYDPVEFHFTGHFNDDNEQPENSTTVPVPMCDGERFAKWEEDKWVVKHLVDGVWVNCTDELPVVNTEEIIFTPPAIEEPVVEITEGE